MSKKDVSAIVSGMGLASSFIISLDNERKKIGIKDEDFHLAIKDGSPLILKFAELIAASISSPQAEAVKPKNPAYPVLVNYDFPLEQAIKAGKYDWANDDINPKNFLSNKTGKAELSLGLIHFNRVISFEDVLKEIDKRGYRPAGLRELLALGEIYHDPQRKFPVMALGSVWLPHGLRRHPYLGGGSGSSRFLDLTQSVSGWSDISRFLVFRK